MSFYWLRALWYSGLWHPMLVQIIPFFKCTYLPPRPLPAVIYLNRIIKWRRGRSKPAPVCPHLTRIPAVLLVKATFECVGFSEAFNPRGICISPVYPPTPTTLLPPSLTETHRGAGERRPSAEWRVKASHIPPALVSPHDLGSAMSSPVTLPYINLGRREIEKKRKVFKIIDGKTRNCRAVRNDSAVKRM